MAAHGNQTIAGRRDRASARSRSQGTEGALEGVFRRQPPLHLPRHLLFAVLAYRLQADELGDLAPDTVRLLKQIGSNGTTVDAARLSAEFDRRQDRTQARYHPDARVERSPHRVMVVDDGLCLEWQDL